MQGVPERSYVNKMVYASLFAALTAVGAWITIPLGIIPLTLQTFFVILAGGVLGSYFGGLSMIVYILLGLVGLPVFSRGQSGLGVLIGPTGGYLIGFVLCAILIGMIIKKYQKPGYMQYLIAMSLGTLMIYICGAAQLMLVAHMAPDTALLVGVLPFIPGDIIKVLVAAYIATRFRLSD
ncbi:BioY family transporter [Methanocella sp. CWC-04]|uniref:BioY family transporter n=1 Tax=Methanooceanicella nereidis TaxID=2052831 RepID=A0AAP2RB22_9EURY|nr:biotin transporter BioY [Methanocella sp. CWC-04]MCD1294229.1 BioY family transporter [Methanocella sp. CWC-04]